jgi:hypothetical protein
LASFTAALVVRVKRVHPKAVIIDLFIVFPFLISF